MSGPVQYPWLDFNLYLITDRNNCRGRELPPVVEEALKGGVKAVQLREKDLSSRDLYQLAYELRKLTSRHDARLFINDRIDIALAVDADGVHLAGTSIPIHRARKILGEKRLIGVSCHNQVSAIAAQETGADFITFGPVFYTPSKAVYGDPVGIDKLAAITELLQIPVFALGGIKRDNVPQVIAAGAHGIALVSALLAAEQPREEAKALLALLPIDLQED
ncbi:MAG: thiamine phosphate synthase [Geobacteraceae bacterium]|nr:thiamine phosphate synthase [Geobacteraceae bacterium]